MKIVVIMYEIRTTKGQLAALRQPNTHYVLLASKVSRANFDPENLAFFHEKYTVDHITVEAVRSHVVKYLNKAGRDQLYLLTSDEGCMDVIARLKTELRMPGTTHAQLLPFIDKSIMKQQLVGSDIRTAKHMAFDRDAYSTNPTAYLVAITNNLVFPIIAKPTSHYGSYKVSKFDDRNALQTWAEQAIKEEINYQLEEFVDGTLYHCDAIIKDQQVIYFTVAEYTVPCMYFSQGYVLGSFDLLPSDSLWQPLADFNKKVIDHLQPPDGGTHLEVFKNHRGELVFLEIAARPPGALVCPIHEKNTGINLEIAHFKALLNMPFSTQLDRSNAYHCWAYFPKKAGVVKELYEPTLSSEYHIDWKVKIGERLEKSKSIAAVDEIAGYLTFYNKNYSVLRQDFLSLKDFQVMRTRE